jgi:hypothetical protein
MVLEEIKAEDLIFSGDIEDDRTNTYLRLDDYDWMNYVLSTRFTTKEYGCLEVRFEYAGFGVCLMVVDQTHGDQYIKYTYKYQTDTFKKHITDFLMAHIASWDDKYAFNGEKYVLDFYNDVISHGTLVTL